MENQFEPCPFCSQIIKDRVGFRGQDVYVKILRKNGVPMRCLTKEQEIEMLKRYALGLESPKKLAHQYGVDKKTFYNIKSHYKKKILRNAMEYIEKHEGNSLLLARLLGISLEKANSFILEYRDTPL